MSHPVDLPGYVGEGTFEGWGRNDVWRGQGGGQSTRAPAFSRHERRAELDFKSTGFMGGDQHQNSYSDTSRGGTAAALAIGHGVLDEDDLEEENMKKYSLLANAAAQAGASDEQVSQMWVTGKDLEGNVWKMTELSQLKHSKEEDRSLIDAPKAIGAYGGKPCVKASRVKRSRRTKSYPKEDPPELDRAFDRGSAHVSGSAGRGGEPQGRNMSSSKTGILSTYPDQPYYQHTQTQTAEKAANNPRKRSVVVDDQQEMNSRKRSKVDTSAPPSGPVYESIDPRLLASPAMSTNVQVSSASWNGSVSAFNLPYTKVNSQRTMRLSVEQRPTSSRSTSLADHNTPANWSLINQRRYDPGPAAHPSTSMSATFTIPNGAFGNLHPRDDSSMGNNHQTLQPQTEFVEVGSHIPEKLPNFPSAYAEVNYNALFLFSNPYLTSNIGHRLCTYLTHLPKPANIWSYAVYSRE